MSSNNARNDDVSSSATTLLPSLVAFGVSSICMTSLLKHSEKKNNSKDQDVNEDVDHEKDATTVNNNNNIDLVSYLSNNHSWRSYTDSDECFVQQFPKVELHVHLDGAFDPDFLWNYVQKVNPNAFLQCLPVNFQPPWDPEGPPLTIQDNVKNCTSARDFHTLCTCRGQRSLAYMLNCFQHFLPLVCGRLDLIEQLAYDFVQRQWEQNIVYTEVRYSPHLLAEGFASVEDDNNGGNNNEIITAESVFQAVTAGLRRGVQEFSDQNVPFLTVNQILCAITWRPEWALDVVEMAKQHQDDFPCAVVGVDIAAGEEHFDAANHPDLHGPHLAMAQKAKEYGIPMTLHAGETSTIPTAETEAAAALNTNEDHKDTYHEEEKKAETPDDDDNIVVNMIGNNVKRAVQQYGAVRVGHGYRMAQDVSLMRFIKRNNVHVEICPTSSDETGGWNYKNALDRDWKKHPCVPMWKHGVSLSLSSDDPAVFHTSLAWQYRLALAKMNFSRADLFQMNLQAVDAAFGITEDERKHIKHMILCFAQRKGIVGIQHPVDQASSTPTWARKSLRHCNSNEHHDCDIEAHRRYWKKAHSDDSFFDRVYIENEKK